MVRPDIESIGNKKFLAGRINKIKAMLSKQRLKVLLRGDLGVCFLPGAPSALAVGGNAFAHGTELYIQQT